MHFLFGEWYRLPYIKPSPFNPEWYSHKFWGPVLGYEVTVSKNTGDITWIHGPIPCGTWPDIKIFKSMLKAVLGYNKKVVADNGYKDCKCVTAGDETGRAKEVHAQL